MRINVIFFLLSFLITTTIFPLSHYQKEVEMFKHGLYDRQSGIMPREEYYAFIEPHIKKAEMQLAIPKYLMNHPLKNSTIKKYFNALLSYNVACFHFLLAPFYSKQYCKKNLNFRSAILENVINDLINKKTITEHSKRR